MRAPRVVDAFLFSTELDLLELRLETLDPVVDRFVLVEATVTFSGRPRPLLYAEHRARFGAWTDRITHVVVDDTPDTGPDRWARERFQRDAVLRGFDGCRADDIVLLSDVDELPHPDRVAERRLGRYEQMSMQYSLNCLQPEEPHYGTAVRRWAHVAALGPERFRARRFALPVVAEGGWHFSSVMGDEAIGEKLRSFSHAEHDVPAQHAAIARRRAALADLFGARTTPLEVLDPTSPVLPEAVRRDPARWSHLLRQPLP